MFQHPNARFTPRGRGLPSGRVAAGMPVRLAAATGALAKTCVRMSPGETFPGSPTSTA